MGIKYFIHLATLRIHISVVMQKKLLYVYVYVHNLAILLVF